MMLCLYSSPALQNALSLPSLLYLAAVLFASHKTAWPYCGALQEGLPGGPAAAADGDGRVQAEVASARQRHFWCLLGHLYAQARQALSALGDHLELSESSATSSPQASLLPAADNGRTGAAICAPSMTPATNTGRIHTHSSMFRESLAARIWRSITMEDATGYADTLGCWQGGTPTSEANGSAPQASTQQGLFGSGHIVAPPARGEVQAARQPSPPPLLSNNSIATAESAISTPKVPRPASTVQSPIPRMSQIRQEQPSTGQASPAAQVWRIISSLCCLHGLRSRPG